MPIILAWLLARLPGFAVSVAIEVLKKTGFFTAAQAEITADGVKILHIVGSVKTYSSPDDFPHGRNGQ